ncbi:tissue alpha-L-fucosidase-like [Hyposmocoma kahamanoa]|uniref:tissue alpha-L-fucosidase-like n=1 Tax=Hyposmocoma kahamanoa TaxID=1477025 RepID=UPI000E6D7386|nr:tissue alpha-L-fucosidase-like [Hyposmocoma kahamanoa]
MWMLILCLFLRVHARDHHYYKPEWEDLDTRTLPKWYDVAKIGIFVHWGVYSVPAFRSEWFWYYWREEDIVYLVGKAVKTYDMEFGIYYSLMEWENKWYQIDRNNNYNTSIFVERVIKPDIKQLILDYKPSLWWSDGDWDADPSYWKATNFLAWLYNESPVRHRIVVNDRWGSGSYCHHGDFYNCDDRFNPKTLQHHKFENALSLDVQSWGYRRNMVPLDTISISQLLGTIASTVSCGGNVLINVGPTKEGVIPPIFRERLLQMGEWLEVNGEAIYDTSPWYHQNDSLNPHVWYTCKKETYDPLRVSDVPRANDSILSIYAIFLLWPVDDTLSVKDLTNYMKNNNYHIQLLGPEKYTTLDYNITSDVVMVKLPDGANMTSKSAYVLKIS